MNYLYVMLDKGNSMTISVHYQGIEILIADHKTEPANY